MKSWLLHSLFQSPSEAPPSPAQNPTAWESDPRWGREHWRIRREPIQWPNGARVAVVCSVPFSFPDPAFPIPEGGGFTGPVARIHVELYGGRQGIWRLLDVLDRYNFKASCEVSGLAAGRFPDAVKAIQERGHEIVGNYWADNLLHDEQTADQDRQFIRRTLSVLEGVVGKRPAGWVAPKLRLGEKTLDFLAEEGIGWHACSLSDDLPYVIHVRGKKMIVFPHAGPQLDDAGFIIGSRRPPEVYLEFIRREFATLYKEGARTPKMFTFSVHPELGARPFFIGAVEEALSYLQSFPDVWFPTRQQVAEWWNRQNYS